ncbi:MAG: hypothetical protein AB1724_02810 [Thermodesulfobacteriota bacterium]
MAAMRRVNMTRAVSTAQVFIFFCGVCGEWGVLVIIVFFLFYNEGSLSLFYFFYMYFSLAQRKVPKETFPGSAGHACGVTSLARTLFSARAETRL